MLTWGTQLETCMYVYFILKIQLAHVLDLWVYVLSRLVICIRMDLWVYVCAHPTQKRKQVLKMQATPPTLPLLCLCSSLEQAWNRRTRLLFCYHVFKCAFNSWKRWSIFVVFKGVSPMYDFGFTCWLQNITLTTVFYYWRTTFLK